MSGARLLVVDDDRLLRKAVSQRMREAGYEVFEADSGASAMQEFKRGIDLVLLDYLLPDTDGTALLAQMRDVDDDAIVIMMTAFSSVEKAVEAMKAGAFHYCTKPVNHEELGLLVQNALETTRLRRKVNALLSGHREPDSIDAIIGVSDAMQRTRVLLRKLAESPGTTILITGETGTGKDLAARAIHSASDRASGPFMNITCSALAPTLFESELFGHEPGAFTDARSRRKGLLEMAEGGTVFLDEVGELPPALQAKLLGFLESHTIRRIGGNVDIRVNVRVIGATNRDLEVMVANGQFREDLFYRLQVLPVELPPLRERMGDVPLLMEYFVGQFRRVFGKPDIRITDDAMEALAGCPWPGNVRELRNVAERAVLLADSQHLSPEAFGLKQPGEVCGEEFAAEFRLPDKGIDLDKLERGLMIQALQRTGGVAIHAARLLNLNRDQAYYRIKKLGIDLSSFAKGEQ